MVSSSYRLKTNLFGIKEYFSKYHLAKQHNWLDADCYQLMIMKTPHSSEEPWYLERWFISGTYNEPSQKPKRSTFLFHEQGKTRRTHNILAAKRAEPSSPLTNSLEAQTVNEEKNYHWTSPELRQLLNYLLSSLPPSTRSLADNNPKLMGIGGKMSTLHIPSCIQTCMQ